MDSSVLTLCAHLICIDIFLELTVFMILTGQELYLPRPLKESDRAEPAT